MIKKNLVTIVSIFFVIAGTLTGCGLADTIVFAPKSVSLPSGDAGSLRPYIQSVSPGRLQTLDIPKTMPTDILPENPGITVVFSHIMDNRVADGFGAMSQSLALWDEINAIPVDVTPVTESKYFVVTPQISGLPVGALKPNTKYVLRVYRTAYAYREIKTESVSRTSNTATIVTGTTSTGAPHGLATNDSVVITGITAGPGFNAGPVTVTVTDTYTFTYANPGANLATTADTGGRVYFGDQSQYLRFDNLVELPATSLNPGDPEYVEFAFQTTTTTQSDLLPPTVLYTEPLNGSTGVDPTGFIEITFNDNLVPMIDPSTVNTTSVTLFDATNALPVPGMVEFITTDTDFKTYHFHPADFLLSNTDYRLHISTAVKDFAGNAVVEKYVDFTTGP